MKKYAILCLMIAIVGPLMAQESGAGATQTESELFMSKPNAVIEKKMVTVGTVPVKVGMVKEDMEVNTLILRDTDTGELKQSMVFDVLDKGKYTIIEKDELDGFLKMLNMMTDKYLTTVPSSYLELVYTTRGGTEAGCFFDDDKWVIFIRLEKSDTASTVEMNPASLELLKGFVGRVKEVISRSGKVEEKK